MALLECVVSSSSPETPSGAHAILQLQRRRVYPADLGYVPREVGIHGHLLEFCGCPIRESMQSTDLAPSFCSYRDRPTFIRLSTWPHMNQKSINSQGRRTSRYSPLYSQRITCKAINASHSRGRFDIGTPAGIPPCRKRVASKCKPRAFTATVGHSLSYLGAQSRIPHTSKQHMGTKFINVKCFWSNKPPLAAIDYLRVAGGRSLVNPYVPRTFAWIMINLETQNYVADWTMSFTWGLVVGAASPIPYFYSVFFITVLIHRTTRDFERYANFYIYNLTTFNGSSLRCALKYGKDWERYCEIVRWKFIPGVY